jgi:sterol desaturase/sphingolipid hydroxylase (fatty acid hydroxylase superfamily)
MSPYDAPTAPQLPAGDDRERWPRIVLGVAVVAVGVAVHDPFAYAAVIGVLVLTPLERLSPRWQRQRVLRRGWATDLVHLVVSLAVFGLLTVVPMTLLGPFVPPIEPIAGWISGQSVLVQGIIGLIVLDLAGYVSHRLQHEVPLLWRFHRIHHSSEELDWLAGARVHPLPGLLDGLLRGVPALLLGLGRDTAGVLTVIVTLTAVLTHANVSWRLPRLSRWWATPEFHHWHHAGEPDAIDKNYAGLLPMWDRLFGTFFLPDRYPHRYGADRPVPAGWWGQLADPFRTRPTLR